MHISANFSAKKAQNGDILCEMRFHVPNNELEIYQEKREQEKAAKRAEKKKAKGENPEEEKKGRALSEEEEKKSFDGE